MKGVNAWTRGCLVHRPVEARVQSLVGGGWDSAFAWSPLWHQVGRRHRDPCRRGIRHWQLWCEQARDLAAAFAQGAFAYPIRGHSRGGGSRGGCSSGLARLVVEGELLGAHLKVTWPGLMTRGSRHT